MAWPPATHQDVQDAVTELRNLTPALRSGGYYFASSPQGSGTSAALGIGTLRVTPFVATRETSLTRLGAEVTVVGDAGSKVRLGIYADSGGYPSSLVIDAGQIAGDSATSQELTIATTLTPGTYWFGAVVQSVTTTQPTVRLASGNWTPPIPTWVSATIPGVGPTGIGLNTGGVTGALPGTFPAGAALTISIPRLFFKVA